MSSTKMLDREICVASILLAAAAGMNWAGGTELENLLVLEGQAAEPVEADYLIDPIPRNATVYHSADGRALVMDNGLIRTVITPWRDFGLDTEEVTLANALAQAGYEHRGVFGKWHLGHHRIETMQDNLKRSSRL